MIGTVELHQGKSKLQSIIAAMPGYMSLWNETETRFQFVDEFIKYCLGWRMPDIHPEAHENGDFLDYSLGTPVRVVWEAKRAGVHFDFPADAHNSLVRSIAGIFSVSASAKTAMMQVQRYCSAVGSEFAVVCNGSQIIAFIAQRVGQPWAKGRALVIPNLNILTNEFSQVWQCLSPDGIAERRLFRLLDTGTTANIPKNYHLPFFDSLHFDIKLNFNQI